MTSLADSLSSRAQARASVRAAQPPPAVARPLRVWQQAALAAYLARAPRDFLAAATPGSGKTAFALRVAAALLAQGVVQTVTVVTPTEHLKAQWAAAAHEAGIALDPTFRNAAGATSTDYVGVAVTYAQVAAAPALHTARTSARRTLVVLDEVHHAGDALSWGEAVRAAFGPATRRLSLTGTPFRSDVNPIPFVHYAPGADGVTRSVADHAYGYADALRDGVVRPVIFLAYSGETRWRTSAGDEVTATLGEPLTPDQAAQAWRTALDPAGDWMPQVLAAADRRLTQVRAGGIPDAGGLVIATDHKAARAYAGMLADVTGAPPTVVLSDDPRASARIETFRRSDARWLVAVRMVSEGVDVPRLAVGVYATSAATPLYFAQAVGRFVRARGRGETASVFLPSVPPLLALAAQMEVERDHALDRSRRRADGVEDPGLDDDLLARANRAADHADAPDALWQPLESSAHLDRVVFDGAEWGTAASPGSDDEHDYLGLPGLLEPAQVSMLLARHQARQVAGAPRSPGADDAAGARATHEVVADLRRELQALVAARHHATRAPHGMVHAELRAACGGPPVARASIEELRARIATVRSWATR